MTGVVENLFDCVVCQGMESASDIEEGHLTIIRMWLSGWDPVRLYRGLCPQHRKHVEDLEPV